MAEDVTRKQPGDATHGEHHSPSPSEKLETDERKHTGSLIPGAENPDSTDIKGEKKWNTE